MNNSRLLALGATGTLVAALCCFTPILVLLFAALGLSAFVGVLDYILVPALLIFASITGYALWQRQTSR